MLLALQADHTLPHPLEQSLGLGWILHLPGQVVDGLQVDPAEIAGTVFINVPLTDDSVVDPEDKARWRNMASPGLILQEHPQGWPAALELATDVELHLLPMGRQTRQNSRILRNLRGWLKRRLQLG